MKRLALAAVAALAATSGAFAADPPMAPPVIVAPEMFDWSGLYIGGHVGGGWGVVTQEFAVIPPGNVFVAAPNIGVSGWLAGVQGGANMQTGRFVLGIEGRVAWVAISGNDGALPVTATFDANWSASGLVRAGVAVGEEGRGLIYVIGGVTGLNYDYTLTAGPAASGANATALGGSVGAGIEFAVTDTVSIFGEYLHTFYGTNTLAIAAAPGIFAQNVNVRPSIGTAQVGVNFHF
jgi:outer membrane immunogenic protein